jgi:hypothetical protein
MRSTFSDWVVDHTGIPDKETLADLALGHVKHRDRSQRPICDPRGWRNGGRSCKRGRTS